MNVVICSTATCIKYLRKYMVKGPDTIEMYSYVRERDGAGEDPIEEFQLCRYVSASEALCRVFDININKTEPAVDTYAVHLPGEDAIVFGEQSDPYISSSLSPAFLRCNKRGMTHLPKNEKVSSK